MQLDILKVIGECFYKVFVMLYNIKISFLDNVSFLFMLLFSFVLGYLIDFLLNAFGNKKGGED